MRGVGLVKHGTSLVMLSVVFWDVQVMERLLVHTFDSLYLLQEGEQRFILRTSDGTFGKTLQIW